MPYNSDDHLSRAQINMLRHISETRVNLPELQMLLDTTLHSLVRRGYLSRDGKGEDMLVTLSLLGMQVIGAYDSNEARYRSKQADLTDRTQKLLNAARLRMVKANNRVA